MQGLWGEPARARVLGVPRLGEGPGGSEQRLCFSRSPSWTSRMAAGEGGRQGPAGGRAGASAWLDRRTPACAWSPGVPHAGRGADRAPTHDDVQSRGLRVVCADCRVTHAVRRP